MCLNLTYYLPNCIMADDDQDLSNIISGEGPSMSVPAGDIKPGQAKTSGYVFGDLTDKLVIKFVKCPPHDLKFDENYFLKMLAGSISLTKEEKRKIIESVSKLSQFQVDELIKILDEERKKFRELDEKHLDQLMHLEQKHLKDWEDLEMLWKSKGQKEEESNQADEIRKQLGL